MMLSDLKTLNLDPSRLKPRTGSSHEITNYDALPTTIAVMNSKGDSMLLSPTESVLNDYWRQFGEESQYRVYISESNGYQALVTTRRGQRVVGAIHRTTNGGKLLALPLVDFAKDELVPIDFHT